MKYFRCSPVDSILFVNISIHAFQTCSTFQKKGKKEQFRVSNVVKKIADCDHGLFVTGGRPVQKNLLLVY